MEKDEQLHLIPLLKGVDNEEGTTTDDIYVEVLQRLQAAQVRLGASIIYEEAEHIEEDEEYREIYVPAEEVQIWFMIEDEIKLYERNKIMLPHSAFDIDLDPSNRGKISCMLIRFKGVCLCTSALSFGLPFHPASDAGSWQDAH